MTLSGWSPALRAREWPRSGNSLRNTPVVSGVNLFFGTGVLVINLIIDLLYVSLDPRVRYR